MESYRPVIVNEFGLNGPFSVSDINSAFRKLSIKYHPDKNPEGAAHFIQLQQVKNLAIMVLRANTDDEDEKLDIFDCFVYSKPMLGKLYYPVLALVYTVDYSIKGIKLSIFGYCIYKFCSFFIG